MTKFLVRILMNYVTKFAIFSRQIEGGGDLIITFTTNLPEVDAFIVEDLDTVKKLTRHFDESFGLNFNELCNKIRDFFSVKKVDYYLHHQSA